MNRQLDVETRLDIADLFGRYCHLVDSNQSDGWAALFTENGVFEVPQAIRLEGTAQLRGMPGVVTQQGGGRWRHQITNIVAEAGDAPDTAIVRAYGLVTDWGKGGAPFAFSDYRVTVRRIQGAWRIESLLATPA
jgi:ketosteroid isomerase-like protein